MHMFEDLYIQYKKDYVKLCSLSNAINMIGGGAWTCYSSGNDSTYDYIANIVKYDDNGDPIFITNVKNVDKLLKNIFKDSDHIYDSYIGIVTWMLESGAGYEIRLEHLKKILAYAYYAYFRIIMIKQASNWFCWENRKSCLINEIKLINYAINTTIKSKKNICVFTFDKKKYKNVYDIICKNKDLTIDKIYIRHKKNKSKYPFDKYSIEPGLSPEILQVGTIMSGHTGSHSLDHYIVTLNNSKKKVWSRFDRVEGNNGFLIEDKYIIDLYGDMYYKVVRRPKIKTSSKQC